MNHPMAFIVQLYRYQQQFTSGLLSPSQLIRNLLFIIVLSLSAVGVNQSIAQSQNSQRSDSVDGVTLPDDTSNPTLATSVRDPLNSPHPIPWAWIVAGQYASTPLLEPQMRYYRSQALVSPDRKYAAYSRIQMELSADIVSHRVHSILFLEDLQTGDLQFVTASSPAIRNPNMQFSGDRQPGMIAVLLPIAWSENSDRLLVRGFDSQFGTDLASDYAIVWERDTQKMRAIAPSSFQYSTSVLLGWSQNVSDRILFRAGQLGDEQWPMVAVDLNNNSTAATSDQPVAYGQIEEHFWNGPQARIDIP
ncbi:MAG: hypothetical protein AAFU78_01775 [Cyanobacteria bacterium J06633_2]